MHIKKIVIQGFKTYKNTTVIDDISPGHNVVVGRNGSGKSNFFAAIRFVLSDQYTRMSKEERQGLIHEGSGTVLSAYVEIIFDNTDGRFPINKDEVVIRRTIGLKKDDYSLDYKSSTRQDITQLLESAGFSKSNPYYIVPQGRITSLTNAKDSERLNLLKEVAGAKVFENKLKESQKEMTKTRIQRDKIDEMLEFIQERLSDLDSEKDELKVFQNLEKDRKIFEFILYDRELNEIANSIEMIDSKYQTSVDDSHRYVQDLEQREVHITVLNNEKLSIKQDLKLLSIDENQYSSTLNEISKQIYEKSANLTESRENFENDLKIERSIEDKLNKINAKITERDSKVNEIKPKVEILKLSIKDLENEILLLRTKQSFLSSKQGRYAQFNNSSERDIWLDSQIDGLNNEKLNINESISNLNNKKSDLNLKLQEIESQINNLQDSINGESAQIEISTIENKINSLKKDLIDLTDSRRNLWREETRCKTILDSLSEEVRYAERQVSQTMDRQQHNGLQAVKRITERLGLQGVHGPLGELIQANQKYKVAIEVIAGNSLFHVVVDNDEVASTLMEELVREKAGRVTFIPLNRISVKDIVYPDSNDCVPLIKKIGFNPEVEKAVRQVFGKTIVSINLERGYELSKQFKLNAITLDGDKADKKGVLTGGYRDFKNSRLESMKFKQDKLKELNNQQSELLKIKVDTQNLDKQILNIRNEISKYSAEYENLLSLKKPLKLKLSDKLNEKFQINDEIKIMNEKILKLNANINNLNAKLIEFNNELNSEFEEGLNSEEKIILQETTKKISDLGDLLNSKFDELTNEESELDGLEIEINEILKPRLNDLIKRQNQNNSNDDDLKIQQLSEELENLNEVKQQLQKSLDQVVKQTQEKNLELKKIDDSLAKADENQRKLLRLFENFQKNSEKYLSRRSLLSKRRDDSQKKIRELGALPEEAFEYDQNISSDDLLKKLTKVIKDLERFSNVNRKALEQYLTFTKQRDGLVSRRKELDKSEESILELINVLKSRKESAIQKTFNQVSVAFSEVFEKLVPNGHGELVMQSAPSTQTQTQQNKEDEESDEEMQDDSIENYTGVSIRVSFNSKHDEQQRIEQLSGGQKSLCAIALILAIQKSDPAPFYLFDEIDANLDTQYRTAVANLIHDLSQNAQFICTTFRPEMLQVANKFFGVMFNNKISTISEIERSDALNFVEGQQQQHQATEA